MAEKKPLKKDLKEVIKEISKAPGGNVAMPRPVTPGGVQGGPPTVPTPIPGAIQKQPEGPLVKRDIARETFRSFKTGEQVTSNIPEPSPDVKKVETKKIKPTGKKGFKGTQEQVNVAKGVRGGTIGGMTRAPGSKPRLDLTQSIIQMAIERVRKQNELEAIQESLRDSLIVERGGKTTIYTSDPNAPKAGVVSRDEQKIIERAAQAARDALLNRDAAIKESVMMRDVGTGEVNPLAERVVQAEAERRTIEGLKSLGKGTAAFGLLGLGADAVLLWKQLLQEASAINKQLQSQRMN